MPFQTRKHIRLGTKLAAALACLLPQDQRDDLRARQVREEEILALFEFDHHPVLHAFEGSSEWWNLEPKLEAPHRAKSRRDTSIVAKVKRIRSDPPPKAGKPKDMSRERISAAIRPNRKISQPSNPWPPKGTRKINGRSTFSSS